MLKKSGIFCAVLLCAIKIHALEFHVNGTEWAKRTGPELEALSYTIPLNNGYYKGISLDELFPAVYEAWKIELRNGEPGNEKALRDPVLGKKLSEIFIVADSGGWSLFYNGQFFKNFDVIELECDVLENAPIEIWINWEGLNLLHDEINRYAELHDTPITVTEVPGPDSKLISVTQAKGDIPDIIMVQSSYMDRLVKSGSIQNIDYMFPPGIINQGKSAFALNDRLWAVPFYYDAQMVFCNPDITAIPDYNWDLNDFEDLCRRAAAGGKIPSAWNSYSASFLIPFQFAFGKKQIVEPDGTIIINDGPTQKALEYILRLQNGGLMIPMERDAMTALFVSGETAMIISASYSIPHFLDLGIPFEAVPMPINTDTGIRISPLLDFKAFAVTKRSKNTIGARRLIEYLCGIGVQQRFTSSTAKLPALAQAWDIAATDNPYYEALKISAEAGTVIPTEKAYSVYKNTMWKMLRFAISGKMSARQVLEKTQDLVNKNLEDRN